MWSYEVLPNDHKDFARHDWLNRWDRDAKIYAFWHRRIDERMTKDYGLSKEDALYWAKIGNYDMWINSNQKTRNIFNNLKTSWINKKITSADPCTFNFFDCNKNI